MKPQLTEALQLIAEGKIEEAKDSLRAYYRDVGRSINEGLMAEELEDELSLNDELEATLSDYDPEMGDLINDIESELILDDGSEELEDLEGSDAVEELEDRIEDVEDGMDSLENAIEELRNDFQAAMERDDELESDEEIEAELDDEEIEGELEDDEIDAELENEDEAEAELSANIDDIEDEEIS